MTDFERLVGEARAEGEQQARFDDQLRAALAEHSRAEEVDGLLAKLCDCGCVPHRAACAAKALHDADYERIVSDRRRR